MNFSLPNIKRNSLTLLKFGAMAIMIILSSWIWLPIITWKLGLILSDNIIKYFVND